MSRKNLATLLFTLLPLCLCQTNSSSVSSNDGAERVIPIKLYTDNGTVNAAHSARICGTPPPASNFKGRLSRIQAARTAEKRGLSRRDSGLHELDLESIYDVIGSDHPDWEHATAVEDDPEDDLRRVVKRATKRQTPSPQIVVETYFHIVSTRDQSQYYTQKRRDQIVNNQIIAMNQAYRPVGVTFHQHPHSYTIKDEWATDAQSDNMKKALRQGSYQDLNIYFQTNLTSGGSGATLLGYCTFPTDITYQYNGQTYTFPQSQWVTDGCNVLAASLPGSPVAVYGYDEGKTAVHEVGHWFGLLHTFQDNTCQQGAQGDLIDDTPQESVSTEGCPTGKDSCPGLPGSDPISNYMDYSDDQCYTNFTPQQIQRMRDLWKNLRQGH